MNNYPDLIKQSGISIYDQLPDRSYFIPDLELERILETHFTGLTLGTLSARTRSKFAKQEVCRCFAQSE